MAMLQMLPVRVAGRRADLNGVQQDAKLSQQSLGHVVAAARVCQDEHRCPPASAERRQLQPHTHTHAQNTERASSSTRRKGCEIHCRFQHSLYNIQIKSE